MMDSATDNVSFWLSFFSTYRKSQSPEEIRQEDPYQIDNQQNTFIEQNLKSEFHDSNDDQMFSHHDWNGQEINPQGKTTADFSEVENFWSKNRLWLYTKLFWSKKYRNLVSTFLMKACQTSQTLRKEQHIRLFDCM